MAGERSGNAQEEACSFSWWGWPNGHADRISPETATSPLTAKAPLMTLGSRGHRRSILECATDLAPSRKTTIPRGLLRCRSYVEAHAKDFENLAETLATFVTLSSIQLALRRLARA